MDAVAERAAAVVSEAAVKAPPAAERVYSHVKSGVLDRRYEGGTLLTEGDLADAVGVSRTPVREALLRLEAEGLLKLYPKKGALVLPVSAQEIADVVETRLLVERHAVAKVVGAVPAGLIARLEDSLAEQRELAASGDLAAFAAADRGFHAEIVRAAGNRILAHLYDQLRDRQLRMGVATMHAEPSRVALTVAEHTEILDALRAGAAEEAESVVEQHISRVKVLLAGSAS
ncbi:GntR family transcriptional regulator [Actinacidiphila acididurans]|uniref:GntR family transcriptional regulator n=1 Tax=Actinacidiphila acididurans TaxID=2784346 RepID=A0ABS2TSS1_9ACTN|nr:GntR family transcriptional regulator [Actinacidiphila acididurans]MBM9505867.1 GntR family transcriptional regulator [Actinacidiphila acididurans]